MLKQIQKRNMLARVLAIIALVALVLGLWGNITQNLSQMDQKSGSCVKAVIQGFPQAFSVFKPKFSGPPASENWPLTIGKLLGSMVTYSAVLLALISVLGEQLERIRISFLSNHNIAFGFSETTKGFLKTRTKRMAAVVVDPENKNKFKEKAHAAGAYYYSVLDTDKLIKDLKSASVKRAAGLLISTGNDQQNLEFLQTLSEVKNELSNGVGKVVVEINDATLRQRLEADQNFMEILGSRELRLFNYSQAASLGLVERITSYFQSASLDVNAPRILLIGGASLSIELVKQLARIMPSHDGFKLSIDWLVESRAELEKELSSSSLPLLELIRGAKEKGAVDISWCLDLVVHEAPESENLMSWPSVSGLENQNFDTVILTAQEEDEGVTAALALREEALKHDALDCPIYVSSKSKGALDQLLSRIDFDAAPVPKWLKHITASPNAKLAVEPFGRLVDVCQWSVPDNFRESRAKSLHESYVKKRLAEKAQSGEASNRDASLKPWNELAETYKNSNRRAADHATNIKWALERYRGDNAAIKLAELTDEEVEFLATIEHNAWRIDRELDGWRCGKTRDNQRKLHPDLVPYDKLSNDIQDYDRAQVRLLLSL